MVTIDLDEIGADRLSGLLGSNTRAGRVGVRLDDLDRALRASSAAAGLVTVVADLAGRPLVDRAAAREDAVKGRAEMIGLLDAALADAGLTDAGWVPGFVDTVRRTGLLTRAGPSAAAAIRSAGAVLAEMRAAGVLAPATQDGGETGLGGWELAELASRCTGDAHGLDDGRVASALVLRAAATALEVPVPETAGARRDLWGRLGVTTDHVSGTVLVWALRPPGNDPWSVMMRSRADLGLVTHLTLQELHGPVAAVPSWCTEGTVVSVVENPQVLQAAAKARVPEVLLCTSGNPSTAGWVLLRRLIADGAAVRYHGDFDWQGVAIAGRVLAAGASPWRMAAEDYSVAVAGLPSDANLGLSGTPVATAWDPTLAIEMERLGVAVHEELILATLLDDLHRPAGSPQSGQDEGTEASH
ncbi:TIGR02679 family protein [Nocardioides sp. SYSU DS0651]|uniref:TIGR02679 family protein n=1 Tax=Nocardioides sp. SYSU DS0651 TaxID=3415955 RepID=UPI003F4BE47E